MELSMKRLEERTALVTGGAHGIGRAIAKRLAAEGAKVTVVDLNAAGGNDCVDEIKSEGGMASLFHADITDESAPQAAVNYAIGLGDSLDILVNNAQYFPPLKALELVSIRDWELSEATGPKAAFRFMQAASPYLRTSGRASVVNVISGAATAGIKFNGPYTAAKGSLLALTKVAANEWAQHKVHVECNLSLGHHLQPGDNGRPMGSSYGARRSGPSWSPS